MIKYTLISVAPKMRLVTRRETLKQGDLIWDAEQSKWQSLSHEQANKRHTTDKLVARKV